MVPRRFKAISNHWICPVVARKPKEIRYKEARAIWNVLDNDIKLQFI